MSREPQKKDIKITTLPNIYKVKKENIKKMLAYLKKTKK